MAYMLSLDYQFLIFTLRRCSIVMEQIDWKYYDKYLDKLEKTLGKRDNFTIDDATRYFVDFCGGKAYQSIDELNADNNMDLNYVYDDLEIYTDYNKNSNKYMCYIIPSKYWGEDDYVWVIYNENREITSFFSQVGYDECKVLKVMCKDWKKDLQKMYDREREYNLKHPVEEVVKSLVGVDYKSPKNS